MTVPPSHEPVVFHNPEVENQYTPLETVIRKAFASARRQLIELVERQRNQVKEQGTS